MPTPASAAFESVAALPAGPQPVPANRRQLLRLRDLCDEVLASHRAAHERDLISGPERETARAMLADLTPRRHA